MSDLAQVTRVAACGMITLRGDLGSAKLTKAVKAVTGQAMPTSGQFLGDATSGVAWMSPDELLLVVPYADVAQNVAQIDKVLVGHHYLAVDVSDARAVFNVSGVRARDVLARLCPVDLHPDSFGVGQFRRTRMAQVAAAFWMHDTGFEVVCFQSVGHYAQDLLAQAAKNATGTGFYAPDM
ncbi:putative sarcosine oxidase gamma subunit [Octadecabacter antarcticus 307]|uniref:Putative sarcosine oxidase gamma subunit n=1 Tax=Octadecabacter antarcticus 307 TaxID=391626 RepID=M9RAJ1_9RHOB|nr:sarcosine oxidase subunit gamma family protein [Octadecabacter antarcticus]AGI68808.1 putative sarcosine oxidase gamma subunit [Octadecabacter antarcticus 307]